MGLVSLKAWRQRSAAQAEDRAALKARLTDALTLPATDALAINEIACPDPGCTDIETVVLLMRAGAPTRAFRVQRAIAAIGAEEFSSLVSEIQAVLSDGHS